MVLEEKRMDKIALLADIQALQSENAALRECLAWYGDREVYRVSANVGKDLGQRARDALGKYAPRAEGKEG